MNLEMLVVWVLVGLAAGWLAGFVIEDGGYGLAGDLFLGLAGSIVGTWVFRALGVSPGAGLFAAVVVAFIGAALVIAAQRQFWHARA